MPALWIGQGNETKLMRYIKISSFNNNKVTRIILINSYLHSSYTLCQEIQSTISIMLTGTPGSSCTQYFDHWGTWRMANWKPSLRNEIYIRKFSFMLTLPSSTQFSYLSVTLSIFGTIKDEECHQTDLESTKYLWKQLVRSFLILQSFRKFHIIWNWNSATPAR